MNLFFLSRRFRKVVRKISSRREKKRPASSAGIVLGPENKGTMRIRIRFGLFSLGFVCFSGRRFIVSFGCIVFFFSYKVIVFFFSYNRIVFLFSYICARLSSCRIPITHPQTNRAEQPPTEAKAKQRRCTTTRSYHGAGHHRLLRAARGPPPPS